MSCFGYISSLSNMFGNKKRLYVGLYARGSNPRLPGKEDAYVGQRSISFSLSFSIFLFLSLWCNKMPAAHELTASSYHWALLAGPKNSPNASDFEHIIYHVKEEIIEEAETDHKVAHPQWLYFAQKDRCSMLLVRIVVAKITNLERLEAVFRDIPIRRQESGYNCITWVQEALEAAMKDDGALGTRVENWDSVRDQAMRYVAEKKAHHRFDGLSKERHVSRPATWDMLQDKETLV